MKRFQSLLAVCFAILLWSAFPAGAANRPPSPDIDALINRVAQSEGVIFIRNGNEYPAAKAAAHLRRKLGAARGRIRTAEQLIEHLGTRSSMSGRKYRVRLPDGREIDSATWLHGLLRELRAHPETAPVPAPSG